VRFVRLALALAIFFTWSLLRAADVIPPSGAPIFNHARYFPAPTHEKEMVGGKFSGSNVSAREGFKVLGVIEEAPKAEQWTDLIFPNHKLYRWLRYDAPPGSHGHVADLEFYASRQKLDGMRFGSIGERSGRGWWLAFDGDSKTWVDTEEADGQYAGLDLGEYATARMPKFSPPPVGVQTPLQVLLTGLTPYATIRYTLDGTMPGAQTGLIYEQPLRIEKTTTVTAAAFVEGWAPSPPAIGTYIIGEARGLSTFHLGNSLTDITAQFGRYARTAGKPHEYRNFTMPGATTNRLWDIGLKQRKRDWEIAWGVLDRIDHLTVQPRDFNIAEEAEYDLHFFDLVRTKTPDVQPWLYAEWVERERQRPTDQAAVPSSQMATLWPALTWEESMGAMLLYVEDLRRKIAETDQGAKKVRVLPSNLALGWMRNLIDRGEFPGAKPGDFYPLLFRDSVHPNANGAYLVDLTWYAAFYGESPEGKVLPVATDLTPEQAAAMQRLAWDVIRNYPDCGLYEAGTQPAGLPEFTPSPQAIREVTPITLSASTPGAWFRYTLDGTMPTRTNGYVYCGVISVRPGMTVKAIAYKTGMGDSPVFEGRYPARDVTKP
jgi:hypothetical protein